MLIKDDCLLPCVSAVYWDRKSAAPFPRETAMFCVVVSLSQARGGRNSHMEGGENTPGRETPTSVKFIQL